MSTRSIVSNVIQTTKMNFEKRLRGYNKFSKWQLQSVSIFFKFVHPYFLLHLLCYSYPLFMLEQFFLCLTQFANSEFQKLLESEQQFLAICVVAFSQSGVGEKHFSDTLLNQNIPKTEFQKLKPL